MSIYLRLRTECLLWQAPSKMLSLWGWMRKIRLLLTQLFVTHTHTHKTNFRKCKVLYRVWDTGISRSRVYKRQGRNIPLKKEDWHRGGKQACCEKERNEKGVEVLKTLACLRKENSRVAEAKGIPMCCKVKVKGRAGPYTILYFIVRSSDFILRARENHSN